MEYEGNANECIHMEDSGLKNARKAIRSVFKMLEMEETGWKGRKWLAMHSVFVNIQNVSFHRLHRVRFKLC